MDGIRHFFTSEELSRLRGLSVHTRYAVEGGSTGGHRSRKKGVSVEFSDYRQYAPGDDLKRIDWRVFGKSERLYLRQSEEESILQVSLFIDGSASMGYASGDCSKFFCSARLAAAIAYATIRAQDAAGLSIFNDGCRCLLPPHGGLEHLRILCNQLQTYQPTGKTAVAESLHLLAERTRRRGLVIVFSDLFDDLSLISSALAHFRRRGHDMILYHVLDRAELEFPFRETNRFQDLENGNTIITSPREIRTAYLENFQRFLTQCKEMCATLGIDYRQVVTDQDLISFLTEHHF